MSQLLFRTRGGAKSIAVDALEKRTPKSPTSACARACDARFDESKHKRDKSGKFSSGGGSVARSDGQRRSKAVSKFLEQEKSESDSIRNSAREHIEKKLNGVDLGKVKSAAASAERYFQLDDEIYSARKSKDKKKLDSLVSEQKKCKDGVKFLDGIVGKVFGRSGETTLTQRQRSEFKEVLTKKVGAKAAEYILNQV